jgi:nuclear transport factor 2 (NTF2) superfamily protein
MSILNKKEQIRIESVEQLEQVYEVLKGEWNKDYPVYEEIDTFNHTESMRYVYWYDNKVALFEKEYGFETISFDQFMSRVNPEPKTETTIIVADDGKKYEVIVVREVVEPMTLHKWYDEFYPYNSGFNVLGNSDQNKYIEEYIQYRKSLDL